MFGHPKFFQPSKSSFPKPAKVSGWLFYIIWIAAILGPSLAMLGWGQYVQMTIWLLISGTWFALDSVFTSRQIRRNMEMDELFYVGEDDSHVSTKNYDLNLRNSSTKSS